MCCTTPGEYIEDAIRSTLADTYETGPSFVLSCFTWDRDEVKTVCRNVRKFIRRHLPDGASDPQKRFHSIPLSEEPGRWGIEMVGAQKQIETAAQPSPFGGLTLFSCSKEELVELFLTEREGAKTLASMAASQLQTIKGQLLGSMKEQIKKASAASKAISKEIAVCERRDPDRASDLRFQNTLLHVEMEVLERQEEIISSL